MKFCQQALRSRFSCVPPSIFFPTVGFRTNISLWSSFHSQDLVLRVQDVQPRLLRSVRQPALLFRPRRVPHPTYLVTRRVYYQASRFNLLTEVSTEIIAFASRRRQPTKFLGVMVCQPTSFLGYQLTKLKKPTNVRAFFSSCDV